GFALDDYTNVVNNPAILVPDLSWHSLLHAMFSFQAGPTMRPVGMLSFAINAFYTGADGSAAFKLTNLIIHVLNGLLTAWLLSQLLSAWRRLWSPAATEIQAGWLAAFTAAAWLLHPLNAMPVLYVVQRETSLSSLFVLLGLCLYVLARRRMLEGQSGGWMLWT